MKQLFFILIFSSLTILLAAEETGIRFEHDATWQQILEKAKKEKKFILLDAYASWCGPCKWMAKEIFPRPEVGKAINPYYVSAKIDMEKGEGIELSKKFEVRNFPTYLFFDPNGNLVHRSLGSMAAKDFIQVCSDALDSTKQYVTLRNKYLQGQRDSAFLKQFSYIAAGAQDSLSAASMLKYFQANNNQLNSNTIQFIFALTASINDTGFNMILNNKEAFYKEIGKDKVDELLEELVWNEAKKAGKKGTDKDAFRKVIQHFLPEKTDQLCAEYELSLLKRMGNWKEYAEKADKFASLYCQNDYQRLNSIAYNLFENYTSKSILEKGLKMALRSVELKSTFENNDTVAHLYYKLNQKANAKSYAQKAYDLAVAAGEESFELEAFLKSLK